MSEEKPDPNAPGTENGGGNDGGDDRTFDQSDVDRIVKERIAKERSKFGDVNELRRKASEFDKLQEEQQSEIEKANAKASEAERKATEAELRALRLEVAQDKGLSANQAKRLAGTTREELESDADDFLVDIKGGEGDGAKGTRTDGRPKERDLKKVPIEGSDGKADMTDMDSWMRQKVVSE